MKYLYVNGCSMSDGTCLVDDPTVDDIGYDIRWSKLLSDKLGVKEINEGEHGGSNDRIVRMTIDWCVNNKDKLTDTIFVVCWTCPDRFEIWSEFYKRYIQISTGHTTHDDVDLGMANKLVKSFIINHFNLSERIKKHFINNVIFLQSFFKSNNIKYIFCDGEPVIDNLVGKYKKYKFFIDGENWWNYNDKINCFDKIARELNSFGIDWSPEDNHGHPGVEAHKYFADKLYKFIEQRVI